MSKKIYDEEYINNTALAVKDITGVEGQFRLCDIPGILRTYKYPNDMTNVRKIKITFKSSYPWSTYGMGLGSIRFKDPLQETNQYYVYKEQDVGTASVIVKYGSVEDIMNNSTIRNCQMTWTDIGTLPLNIIIEFANGIDFTTFNVLEMYPDANRVVYGPPAVVNIDVLTGDPEDSPEYYTNLYTNLELPWVYDTLNPVYVVLGSSTDADTIYYPINT